MPLRQPGLHLLVAIFCLSFHFSAQAGVDFGTFFKTQNACDILDYTGNGIVGDMLGHGIESLSSEQLNEIAEKGSEATTLKDAPGPDYRTTPEVLMLMGKKRLIPNRLFFGYRRLFQFKHLIKYVYSQDAHSLNLIDLQIQADLELVRRQRIGLGDCFYVSYYSNRARVDSLTQELPMDVQQEMVALFDRKSLHINDSLELELLRSGELDGDEVHELRAMSEVSALFEQHTVLRNDKGGWGGNYKWFQDIKTMCAEEYETHFYFLNRLVKRGLIRKFSILPLIAVRGRALAMHGAIPLINLRTSKIFVFDSWIDDGGRPARIFRLEDWMKKHDDLNLVEAQ